MKKLLFILVCGITVLFSSCKEPDKSYYWDSEGIRYLENGEIVYGQQYYRTEGSTGIIGSFGYSTDTSAYSYKFCDSKSDKATFEYFFVSTKTSKKTHYSGTYKLYIDDEGCYVVHTYRSIGGESIFKYYIKDDVLVLKEIW